jgi:hypothetical protein
MITLKEWMELVDHRITEGSTYGWHCYGSDAYCLDSWNGDQDGHSLTVIFDTRTQTVYEVQAHDYSRNRAYRLINPDYVTQHSEEASGRGVAKNEAWDDLEYVDLETDGDFMEKAAAIVADQDYDTRVQVPVNFTDDELLQYMKMAHERDITFNQLVEQCLREVIKQLSPSENPDFPVGKKKKKKRNRD